MVEIIPRCPTCVFQTTDTVPESSTDLARSPTWEDLYIVFLKNVTRHDNPDLKIGVVSAHEGCVSHPFFSVFFLFTSALVSRVCVYACLFYSQSWWRSWVHQIIFQNKSMANNLLHPSAPYDCTTLEQCVHSSRGAGEDRTEGHGWEMWHWWFKGVKGQN